jgi:cytochrome oxidase Cu insertion factor (SCO1/SenC/PrrC family)
VSRPLALALAVSVAVGLVTAVALHALLSRTQAPAVPVTSANPYRGSLPPPNVRAPSFTLRDYRGGRVTMSEQRGRVVVLSFVDSKCKEACPIVVSVMAAALRRLPKAARADVVPLLITVNPRLDTANSIRSFLARRRALSLSYLTGTVRQLRPVWKAYGILPAIDTGDADVHSSDVRIFDRRGIWLTTQRSGQDLTPANLVHDLLLALRRKSAAR